MAFRDTLSKVASTVGGRANNAIESGKLNLKIGSEERKIADYTRSIGALLVERLDAGEDFGDEVAALYESIKASRDVIAAAKAEIEENKQELEYIETVIDELTRSETQSEIDDISAELAQNGYGKRKNAKDAKKRAKAPEMLEYVTSDGFTVFAGKNNNVNDYLTFKKAAKNDMWLHAKNVPGSHVVIVSDNREISDKAIEEASVIAAYHSRARQSYQVQVDYTFVREIKKPVGAKPGKVIYHKYYTITANPDYELVNKLKKQ